MERMFEAITLNNVAWGATRQAQTHLKPQRTTLTSAGMQLAVQSEQWAAAPTHNTRAHILVNASNTLPLNDDREITGGHTEKCSILP